MGTKLTLKSDIYSFGIVLLEARTCRASNKCFLTCVPQ